MSLTELSLGCAAAVPRCGSVLQMGFSPVYCHVEKLGAVTEAAAFFTWPLLLRFSVSPFNLKKSCTSSEKLFWLLPQE